MNFDNGEVLQGLNETWTFMGANAVEWIAGLVVFMIIHLFAESPGKAMPFMLAGWVMTTVTLASIRKMYPDEERGVRNAIMAACGFVPKGIPAPAGLQPIWSDAPIRQLDRECDFVRLGLETSFPYSQINLEVAETPLELSPGEISRTETNNG